MIFSQGVCMNNEDFDIKIFSPIKKIEETEPVIIADEMKRQVISGNLQKAKLLGESIADSFREAAEKEELWNLAQCCSVELSRDIKDQAIILSVFAAEYCLNNLLTDSILSTSSVSTLYATLTKEAPELYNKLLASTAFSFYYMNIDGKVADSEIIGITFAMLCGDKKSSCLVCYGKNVFEAAVKQYQSAIKSVDFSD